MESSSAKDVGTALAAAQSFLSQQGATLELLRLEVLLGERSRVELEQALAPGVREDGRDACLALELLEALADAECLNGPLADRVAEPLPASQRPDGSWHAPGSASAPAAARPAVGARDPLFLTARLGAFLGRTARSNAASLRAAGGYLALHWSPALVQSGSWHAICGYAHYFSNIPHEISDGVLQWCGRELERAFRVGAFDAVRAARIFTLCDAHALPGARLDAVELLSALLRTQSADGGWPASTTDGRVLDTLWAALALVKLRPRSQRRAAR